MYIVSFTAHDDIKDGMDGFRIKELPVYKFHHPINKGFYTAPALDLEQVNDPPFLAVVILIS